MPYDSGLVERVADALVPLNVRGARQRSMFGGRGFMLGKLTFVIVWGEGIIVKVPPAEYEAALREPGASAFRPDGGTAMGTWVVVAADAIADDPQVKTLFGAVEAMGLGRISDDMKRKGLAVGAMTRRALGLARSAQFSDLSAMAIPLDPPAAPPPAKPGAGAAPAPAPAPAPRQGPDVRSH